MFIVTLIYYFHFHGLHIFLKFIVIIYHVHLNFGSHSFYFCVDDTQSSYTEIKQKKSTVLEAYMC